MAHFYRHIEQMVQTTCRFIADGLQRSEAVVVIASQAHWEHMVGKLATTRGIDVVDAIMSGQLRHIDVNVVLSGLLENGMLHESRFQEHTGHLIKRSLEHFGTVRIVTELAGMLWESGNRAAALRLEELWNILAERLPFTLLYLYRSDDSCLEAYNSALKRVCGAHSSRDPDGCRQETRQVNTSEQDDPYTAKP